MRTYPLIGGPCDGMTVDMGEPRSCIWFEKAPIAGGGYTGSPIYREGRPGKARYRAMTEHSETNIRHFYQFDGYQPGG